MTNEVTKSVFGGNVAVTDSAKLLEALTESAARDPRGSASGADYMNFSGKVGRYEIGKDKVDVDPEEVYLINIASFEDGYICWKDGKPVATRLYPMGTPIPPLDRSEHGPFVKEGDGWQDAKSLVARSIDTGNSVYFKNNSVSGVSEFASLQKQVMARLRTGQPSWPLVQFGKEPFTAKGFKNFKPVFNIVGWLSDEACVKLGEIFEDEEAEIDLDELIAMSGEASTAAIAAESEKEETAPVVRRAKRSSL